MIDERIEHMMDVAVEAARNWDGSEFYRLSGMIGSCIAVADHITWETMGLGWQRHHFISGSGKPHDQPSNRSINPLLYRLGLR